MVTAHARAVGGVDDAGAGRTTKISVSLFLGARRCSRQVRFCWGVGSPPVPMRTRAGAIYILGQDPTSLLVQWSFVGVQRTPA